MRLRNRKAYGGDLVEEDDNMDTRAVACILLTFMAVLLSCTFALGYVSITLYDPGFFERLYTNIYNANSHKISSINSILSNFVGGNRLPFDYTQYEL
jgi:hypothetical protein